MSASEKLKALVDDPERGDYLKGSLLVESGALPQIVAVVEAAERFTAAVDHVIADGQQPALAPACIERVALDEFLRPSLTALDEALS